MDDITYNKLAGEFSRDDAGYNEATERSLDCANYLDDVLEGWCATDTNLDNLKRHIFYNKGTNKIIGFECNKTMQTRADEDLAYPKPVTYNQERTRKVMPLLHGLIGLRGEISEVVEHVLEYLNGDIEEIDPNRIVEETGDLAWYMAEIYNWIGREFNISTTTIKEKNIDKLSVRFKGKKFTFEEVNNRDLEEEAKAYSVTETEPKEYFGI